MVQSRISYNVNGYNVGDPNYFRSTIQAINPTTIVVMNNLGLAIELLHSIKDCIVIFRQYTPADGDYWRLEGGNYIDPVKFVNGLPKIQGLVHYVLNEPHANKSQLPQLLRWLVDVMKEAAKQNVRLCVGNFYAGFAEIEYLEQGIFDEFLETLGMYSHLHFGGWHEGAAFLLPWGTSSITTDDMYHKERVQREAWKTAAQLKVDYAKDNYPPYWMVRRTDWYMVRAIRKGYKPFKAIITEYTLDWNNIPGIPQFLMWLRDNHGGAVFADRFLGVNTYANAATSYYPQWTFEDWWFEQLKWSNEVYPEYVVGVCQFTWNRDNDWVRNGYDMSGHTKVHQRLINEKLSPPIPDVKPESEPQKFIRVRLNGTNLRDLPSVTRGTWLRSLRKDDILTPLDDDLDCAIEKLAYAKEEFALTKQDLIWIRIETQQGYSGWVSARLLDYR